MNLKDKVVIVTGASSGIGEQLAYELAKKGARVALAARNAEALNAHAAKINADGGKAIAVPTDVSRRFQVEALVRRTVSEFGRLDVMVNNAGISPAKGTILENSEEDVRATFETNFMGCLYGVWAAAPHMEKDGGIIAFVSSIIGKRGIPLNAAYCASKFALQGLAESIRPELKKKNVKTLVLCPAGVDTAFYKNNGKAENKQYRLYPADKIARMIVKAIEKEKREVLLTMDAKLLHWLNVFAPGLSDVAIAKVKGV